MNNTGTTMLSILIPSIPERAGRRMGLYRSFVAQSHAIAEDSMLGDVEILYDDAPSFRDGGPTVGEKRTALVNRATGKYLCFIDDDDIPAPNYIESLLRLCQFDADICTFRAFASLKNYWAFIDMKLAYKVNDQLTPLHTVRRPPWHVCPVRAEFAKLYEFPSINNAEDFVWMERVLSHCTTEVHTDAVLFRYNHGDHSEVDKIEHLTSDVGVRIENPNSIDNEIILPL